MFRDADGTIFEPAVSVSGYRNNGRLPLMREPAGSDDAFSPREIAAFVAMSFRNHGHLGNVLTHISAGNWKRVEEALCAILDPYANSSSLTPLACNIVELMCADGGVTGRILKPFYQQLLIGALGEDVARCVINNVTALFTELEVRARNSVRGRLAPAVQSSEKTL
jgi:hypothetical protein